MPKNFKNILRLWPKSNNVMLNIDVSAFPPSNLNHPFSLCNLLLNLYINANNLKNILHFWPKSHNVMSNIDQDLFNKSWYRCLPSLESKPPFSPCNLRLNHYTNATNAGSRKLQIVNFEKITFFVEFYIYILHLDQ